MFAGMCGMVGPVLHTRSTMIEVIRALNLETSLQYVVDAGDAISYPGSGQTVTDRSGTGTNFVLGSSAGDATNDPTYVGIAGRQSAEEYFRINPYTEKLVAASVGSWVHTLHKENAVFTWVGWRRFTHDATNGETLVQTVASDSPSSPGIYIGVIPGASPQPLSLIQSRSYTDETVIANGPSITSGWMFLAVSYTEATGAWLIQVNASQSSGTKAYVSPGSGNAPTFRLLDTGDGDGDIHADALWLRALSSTELTSLYNTTKSKFGL